MEKLTDQQKNIASTPAFPKTQPPSTVPAIALNNNKKTNGYSTMIVKVPSIVTTPATNDSDLSASTSSTNAVNSNRTSRSEFGRTSAASVLQMPSIINGGEDEDGFYDNILVSKKNFFFLK